MKIKYTITAICEVDDEDILSVEVTPAEVLEGEVRRLNRNTIELIHVLAMADGVHVAAEDITERMANVHAAIDAGVAEDERDEALAKQLHEDARSLQLDLGAEDLRYVGSDDARLL